MEEKKKIVFLHLHKCAGSAYLRHLSDKHGLTFNRATNGNLNNEPSEGLKDPFSINYDIIAYEHVAPPFELYDVYTICIFRHPVDRLWSNYHFDLRAKIISMSFKEYCLSSKTAGSGIYNLPNMYQRYFGGTMHRAFNRIAKIDRILIQEEDLTDVPIFNTTDKQPISQEDYDFALELNTADMRIYEYAKKIARLRKYHITDQQTLCEMEDYLKSDRPYLSWMTEYYGRHNRRVGVNLKLKGEAKHNLTVGSNSSLCAVFYASNNNQYNSLMERASSALRHHGFQGDILTLSGGFPSDIRYAKSPYGFKFGCLELLQKLGYRYGLYIDTAIIATQSVSSIFGKIQSNQIFVKDKSRIADSWHKEGREICGSEGSFEAMGVSLDSLPDIPHVSGAMLGIDYESPMGIAFMEKVKTYALDIIPFCGGCPDENVYSVALWQIGFEAYDKDDLISSCHTMFYYDINH